MEGLDGWWVVIALCVFVDLTLEIISWAKTESLKLRLESLFFCFGRGMMVEGERFWREDFAAGFEGESVGGLDLEAVKCDVSFD